MNFREKGGGDHSSQKNFVADLSTSRKNATLFSETRAGGIRGRLEVFHFGEGRRHLGGNSQMKVFSIALKPLM